jgi:hypothetical protein
VKLSHRTRRETRERLDGLPLATRKREIKRVDRRREARERERERGSRRETAAEVRERVRRQGLRREELGISV